MSGHFDDIRLISDDAATCIYCRAVRDEPCSQFVSRAVATERCAQLREQQRPPASNLIQIGPLDC